MEKNKKKPTYLGRQRQEFDSEEHNPVRRVEEVSNQIHNLRYEGVYQSKSAWHVSKAGYGKQ